MSKKDIKVSLIASSVRPLLYKSFFDSLIDNTIPIEIIFTGFLNQQQAHPENLIIPQNITYKYITTHNIKPAQCYEIARRHSTGELICWVADDCEFPDNVIRKSYIYWKVKNNKKLVLSIQTKESGYGVPLGTCFDMEIHRFFGGRRNTPLMAPLGIMNREYLNELGGFDKRYVCGQYENDCVMRVYADGGEVEIFKDSFITIDHLGKSLLIGESKKETDFLNRPFARGYAIDRKILESSWVKDGRVTLIRNDNFEPYDDTDLLNKSQNNKGQWE